MFINFVTLYYQDGRSCPWSLVHNKGPLTWNSHSVYCKDVGIILMKSSIHHRLDSCALWIFTSKWPYESLFFFSYMTLVSGWFGTLERVSRPVWEPFAWSFHWSWGPSRVQPDRWCQRLHAGLVTNSILFCWVFTIKDWCEKVRFQKTHN